MRALVTGGTGFIGSHLVEALLSAGCQVRCLVRSRRRLRWLTGLPVELHEGDCTDPASLRAAVRGVQQIYHLAGVTRARRPEAYFLHNAEGTRHLLEACVRENRRVERFVYLSSQAAAGPATEGRPVREEDPPRPLTPYGESKRRGEEEALRFRDRVSSIILRPSAVYGPRDRDFLLFFRLVDRGLLIRFGGKPRTVSLCYVEDLIPGILAAGERPVPSGSIYFLADPRPYPWEEVEAACRIAIRPDARRLRLPAWLLWAAAWGGEVFGAVSGREVILNRARAAELLEGRWSCEVSRAERELGFAPKWGLQEGIRRTVAWYRSQGWL